MSYTKGKWELNVNPNFPIEIRCNVNVICDVTRTYVGTDQALANANLICAAPALLEALEGLYQMVQDNYHVDDNNDKFIKDAYEAIALARG